MVDLKVKTLGGEDSLLSEAGVGEFKKSLRGQLLCPADEGYNMARTVWNANVDKLPALIARCASASDVIQAVNFARDNHLLVSVRGGGHNFSGTCVADDGMVIDLSLMNSVRVDPARRTARAEGGTKWGQFDRETQAFGLACTGGTNYDTGIGGLTLGGGMGWLGGKYGLALDNLISVDIVTADGQLHVASATENPDLFWAVRGGGGNFGVVTSFEYQVHPVGDIYGGPIFYELDRAGDVLRFFSEFIANAPEQMGGFPAFQIAPPLPFIPEERHGDTFALAVNHWAGPVEEGEAAIRPFRD